MYIHVFWVDIQIVIKSVVWSIHPFNQQYLHPSIQPTLPPSIQPTVLLSIQPTLPPSIQLTVLLSILLLHQQYFSPVKGPSGRLCLPRCPYLGNTLGFVLFWIHSDLYNTRLIAAICCHWRTYNVKRDQCLSTDYTHNTHCTTGYTTACAIFGKMLKRPREKGGEGRSQLFKQNTPTPRNTLNECLPTNYQISIDLSETQSSQDKNAEEIETCLFAVI